jgi:membrane-anchored protein YejM (alkaline phosphatase superfamily)
VSGLDPLHWPTRVGAELVTDRAVALVTARESRGWFLFVNYVDAGGPFFADAIDEQAVGLTTRPWPADRYDAAIHRVDRELQRLLDALPSDAWVIVVGDRGLHLSEERKVASQGVVGMRFGHTMFEELLRVPLVVHGPGVSAGRVAGAVSVTDIGPTLVRAAGLEPLLKADGAALERVFGAAQTDRVVVAQSSLFGQEQQAVILGKYKLIDMAAGGRTPLFDLEADPSESFPLTTGADTDNVERRMLAVLPPPGAGVDLQEPPSLVLRLGQLASRFTGR